MSILVLIPPADHLPARTETDEAGMTPSHAASLRWVWADEGGEPSLSHEGPALRSGQDSLARLPQATQRLLALPPSACSWHRLKVPKVPASKLKPALQGALEDQLLTEPERVHLALAPGAKAGDTAWVAAIDHAWLSAWLSALEAAGLIVDRVLPSVSPRRDGSTQADLKASDQLDGDGLHWLWSSPEGAGTWPWAEDASAADLTHLPWVPGTSGPVQWRANPGAMRWASEHLGTGVTLRTDAQWWMTAAQDAVQDGWECRQFDLSARHAGLRAGRRGWQIWSSPAWRPVRWGLAALLSVQIAGLAWAGWQQTARIQQLQQAQRQLLQQTFPTVKTIIDAPLQMRRATEAALQAAGEPGPEDLETVLAITALAWPQGASPAWALQQDGRSLILKTQNWTPAQTQQFQQALRSQGWEAREQAGVLRLSRGGW